MVRVYSYDQQPTSVGQWSGERGRNVCHISSADEKKAVVLVVGGCCGRIQ